MRGILTNLPCIGVVRQALGVGCEVPQERHSIRESALPLVSFPNGEGAAAVYGTAVVTVWEEVAVAVIRTILDGIIIISFRIEAREKK